jgi:hypothetical protein
METRGAGVDLAELIKWWDVLDLLLQARRRESRLLVRDMLDLLVPVFPHVPHALARGVALARECRHPDAQWLAALFPPGAEVTPKRLAEVMSEQGEDERALLLAWAADAASRAALVRSAEMGYAPAQAQLASQVPPGPEKVEWAQRAADQGDRFGLFLLAQCVHLGRGCEADLDRGVELYRRAAELGLARAQNAYAMYAFRPEQWQRCVWQGRAAMQGLDPLLFCNSVLFLFWRLEGDEQRRMVHAVGGVVAKGLDAKTGRFFGSLELQEGQNAQLLRVVQLHESMMQRARQAIDCWSVVARRCGMAKDMRVLIAKMAWEEAWRWGDTGGEN